MSRRSLTWGVWLLALAPACGGNVERSGSRDRDLDPDPDAVAGKPAEGDGKTPSGMPLPDGDTELGDCKLGPKESFDVDCAWVAEDRCYTTREMACNCACPNTSNSQCASGFEAGPNGHVWVSCG
jgi:hypothetical protein